MNRETKFRAWIKYNKEMKEVFSLDFINKKAYIKMNKSVPFGYVNFDGCELMQYTRIKDINGTEVYEGDIVKVYVPSSFVTRITAIHGTFKTCEVVFEYGCWGVKEVSGEYLNNLYEAKELEIIGNKYVK